MVDERTNITIPVCRTRITFIWRSVNAQVELDFKKKLILEFVTVI